LFLKKRIYEIKKHQRKECIKKQTPNAENISSESGIG
jgi:hypothetical protein